MKRFISIFMIIGALMCVLYIGVAAEPSDSLGESSSSDESISSDENGEYTEESSSDIIGVVSIESITVDSSSSKASQTSSKKTSSVATSSTATSSRYGANAYDPTEGENEEDFGDPVSDDSIDMVSKETVSNDGSEKNIFNLSKLLKGLIFIPIALIIASVAALIYVNRKEFAGAKTKKSSGNSKGGKHTRKKNNKDK